MKYSTMKKTDMWRGEPESYIGQLYFYLMSIHIHEIKELRPTTTVLGIYMARDMVRCCQDIGIIIMCKLFFYFRFKLSLARPSLVFPERELD